MSKLSKAYFQGAGEANEPSPKKKKYKGEPINQDLTKARGVFFKNYDLYDTGGPSPGTGLYQHMSEYESVSDFRRKKRKENISKRRKAFFEALLLTTASDKNNLTDATEDTITSIPWNPGVGSPVGLLDNMYPGEDLEDKPVSNLYYGRLETHPADDKKK